MRSVLLLAVISVPVLGFGQTNTQTQKQSETHHKATLEEQKLCSEQAMKFAGAHSMVVNHYDKDRNICFVRTWETLYDPKDEKKFVGSALELKDAFEGFTYALCMTDENNKVLTCWSNEPSGNTTRTFTTTDEWTSYVTSTYMSR